MRHFAGDVAYEASDFLIKNVETIEAHTQQLLATPRLGPLLRAMQRLLDYNAGGEAAATATPVELAPTIEMLDDVMKRFWAEGMVLK